MKVFVRDLIKDLHIAITGNEDWLRSIYDHFPLRTKKGDSSPSVPRLTGDLTVSPLPGGEIFRITGEVDYKPFVDCSRCNDQIGLPIHAAVDIYVEPQDGTQEERDVNLVEGDLDRYFYTKGVIDIEELVNDVIHLEIPSQVLLRSEDGKSCMVCGDDVSGDKIFSTGEGATSPFAILGNQKH